MRPTAIDAIEHLRRLVAVLENHGIQVQVLKTVRPGYLVYEDKWQVVAEPFNREKI